MVVMVLVMVALAFGIIAFVVMVVMVLVMVALTLGIIAFVVVVVMVLVMVALAFGIIALVIVVVMVLVMVALTLGIIALVIMVVMVLVMVALTFGIIALVIMVVMVMMMGILLQTVQLFRERVGLLHRADELLAIQQRPRSRHDGCRVGMLAQHRKADSEFVFLHIVGMAEHDTTGMLDLIVEEFAKVFHIQLAFACVNNGCVAVQNDVFAQYTLHGLDDVGQFSNAGGLDQNAIGLKFVEHLGERLGEITHQRAANAALIHFGDLHTAFFEKSAVNADFTEFVFDENNFLAGICLL